MTTTFSSNNGKSSKCGIFFPYKIDSTCVWNLECGLDMHPSYRNYQLLTNRIENQDGNELEWPVGKSEDLELCYPIEFLICGQYVCACVYCERMYTIQYGSH